MGSKSSDAPKGTRHIPAGIGRLLVAGGLLVAGPIGFGGGTVAASPNSAQGPLPNGDYHGHSFNLGNTHNWTVHNSPGNLHVRADQGNTSKCVNDVVGGTHAHCNTAVDPALLDFHHIGFHQGSHFRL